MSPVAPDQQQDRSATDPLAANLRPVEAGLIDTAEDVDAAADSGRALIRDLDYAGYLHLERLLSAQEPLTDHHDELLFIVIHQATELWLKLVVHEMRSAQEHLRADEIGPALKRLARVKHVLRQLIDQWAVLATLTPSEYAEFRGKLGRSSGFQSVQYRELEFLLGNKNKAMIAVFDHDKAAADRLRATLAEPSLYDDFLDLLARRGYQVPDRVLQRDRTAPHTLDDGVTAVFGRIYGAPESQWDVYETCEELVDLEDSFQTWRFRHLKTVERIIGFKPGTGGSSGVPFLRRALDLTFFPELYAVRAEIGN